MKNKLIGLLKLVVGAYVVLSIALYFLQESLIFFPHKLDKNYQFNFPQDFQELNFKASDGKLINGLLFKAVNSKGLIFYLHGNAGALNSWGNIAKTYTDLNYDIFIVDYRGFGKSVGSITSQQQLFADNQLIYNELKAQYKEQDMILIGYSLGTAMAAKLAAENQPKHLILQAPYYNLSDEMRQRFPLIPTFILRYKLATNEFLSHCQMPVTIFHGNRDGVINHQASLKLKAEFNRKVELIVLDGQGHNGMTDNSDYKRELIKILK